MVFKAEHVQKLQDYRGHVLLFCSKDVDEAREEVAFDKGSAEIGVMGQI